MGSNRLNFTKATRNALAIAAGHHCVRCGKRTHSWEDGRGMVGVGRAAHDAAASKGGPRYDPDMTPAQVRAAANGAWLCANCAALVDTQSGDFPPGAISQLQQEAVQRSRQEVYATPLRQQGTIDLGNACAGAKRFCARVRGIHMNIGYQLNVMIPQASISKINDLSQECRDLGVLSPLSAQVVMMVDVQRNLLGSLNAIAAETANRSLWWLNPDYQAYQPAGVGPGMWPSQEHRENLLASADRIRTFWGDMHSALEQLVAFSSA